MGLPNRSAPAPDRVGTAAPHAAAMASMLIWIPPELIALFKAIIESYDNLATLRTEDPERHYLRLYFAPESAAEISALLDSLTARFTLRRLA